MSLHLRISRMQSFKYSLPTYFSGFICNLLPDKISIYFSNVGCQHFMISSQSSGLLFHIFLKYKLLIVFCLKLLFGKCCIAKSDFVRISIKIGSKNRALFEIQISQITIIHNSISMNHLNTFIMISCPHLPHRYCLLHLLPHWLSRLTAVTCH